MITGAGINMLRFRALLGALKLEMVGIKMSRGRSAYSVLKDELGLKGSKQKVYNQALELFNQHYPVPEK